MSETKKEPRHVATGSVRISWSLSTDNDTRFDAERVKDAICEALPQTLGLFMDGKNRASWTVSFDVDGDDVEIDDLYNEDEESK